MSVIPRVTASDTVRDRLALGAAVMVAGTLIGWAATWDPTMFAGVGLAFVYGALFVGAFQRTVLARVPSASLRRLMLAGLALRVPIVLSHIGIGIFLLDRKVDFFSYFGTAAAGGLELLQGEFRRFAIPEAHDIGGWLVTVLIVPVYFLLGGNLFGTFLLSAVIGFLGGVLFLRAYQLEFDSPTDERFFARCLFFYPSLAFWSSLLGKDSWVFFFLGLATYGLARFIERPGGGPALSLCLGTGFMLIIRPPIGAAMCVAIVAAGLIASRDWTNQLRGAAAILKPVAFIVLTTLILGGSYYSVIGPLQKYGIFGETASPVQGLLNVAVERHVGLSSDPSAAGSSLKARIETPTTLEALKYLPEALLTFLFRPHIFEAHNMLAMVAALDSTGLLLIVLWRFRHLLGVLRHIRTRPLVLFALLCFTLFTAGLSFEANFGAIVRHRIMVMPFLFMLLAVPLRASRQPGGSP